MAFRIGGPYELELGHWTDPASTISVRFVDKKKSVRNLRTRAVGQRTGGLYIFAIRRQRGSGIPWYVGKDEGNLRESLYKESLTNDKLRKYARALAEAASGAALLFFLSPEDSRSDHIARLETFLIWLASQRNPNLLNERKVRLTPQKLHGHLKRHRIVGVLNPAAGNPGRSAAKFREMIGWNRTMHVGRSET